MTVNVLHITSPPMCRIFSHCPHALLSGMSFLRISSLERCLLAFDLHAWSTALVCLAEEVAPVEDVARQCAHVDEVERIEYVRQPRSVVVSVLNLKGYVRRCPGRLDRGYFCA